jgi:hypothetical protein
LGADEGVEVRNDPGDAGEAARPGDGAAAAVPEEATYEIVSVGENGDLGADVVIGR